MHEKIQRGVARLDAGGTLRRPRRNAAGFLEVDALLSRTGVYEYQQPDGSMLYELRREEDVFAPAALAGFESVPVTREHPPGMVTPGNAREHMRGIIQGKPWRDGNHVGGTLVIHDEELAREVESGARAGVSPGYLCDVEPPPPGLVVDGKAITGIQTNFRPNHVAACEHPRGGDTRVRLDGLSTSGQDGGSTPTNGGGNPPGAAETMTMKKVTIGGLPYEVPEQAALALEQQEKLRQDSATAAEAKAKAAEKEAGEQRARADSLQEEKKKLEEKVQKLDADLKKASSPEAQRERVTARVALETTARSVLGKVVKQDGKDVPISGLSDEAIRVAVLQKRNPDFKLDSVPEGQRDSYLRFRFDEEAKRLEREAARRRQRQDGEGEDMPRGDEDAAPTEDAEVTCPECGGEKVIDGEPCPTCEGAGVVEEESEGEPSPGTRQDSREPRRVPAGYRADGRRERRDAKDEYLNHLNNQGLLPSQRASGKK
jgi:uncharacterized protein